MRLGMSSAYHRTKLVRSDPEMRRVFVCMDTRDCNEFSFHYSRKTVGCRDRMRGKFFVLEGPDGSGTTMHASLLAKKLTKIGKDVLLTMEPSESDLGRFIRKDRKST